jgi:hypothetical protein
LQFDFFPKILEVMGADASVSPSEFFKKALLSEIQWEKQF